MNKSDEKTFIYTKGFKWLCIFGILFFWGMLLGSIFFAYIEDNKGTWVLAILCSLIFGPIGYQAYKAFKESYDSIITNDNKLIYRSPKNKDKLIPWEMISVINERPILQRLELLDDLNHLLLKIEYQINNFDELRNVIKEKAVKVKSSYLNCRIFHRKLYDQLFFILGIFFFLFLAILSSKTSKPFISLLFIGFSILSLIAFLMEPKKVIIGQKEIVISNFPFKRSLLLNDVIVINIKTQNVRGNSVATVFIERKAKKPIKLVGFKEGGIALEVALNNALNDFRKNCSNKANAADAKSRAAD